MGKKWLQALFDRVLPAQSWEMLVDRNLPAKIGQCYKDIAGHNFDLRGGFLNNRSCPFGFCQNYLNPDGENLHRWIFKLKILHRQFYLNGEIYTAGKNFILPPALTGWTNSTSAANTTTGHQMSQQWTKISG